jgi:hypothetical protein
MILMIESTSGGAGGVAEADAIHDESFVRRAARVTTRPS